MFQKFTEDSKKVLKKAKKEMQELKHPFVGSEHLILSILSNKDLEVTKKLNEYNIYYHNFKEKIIKFIGIGNSLNDYFIYTPLLKRIIENAIIDTKDLGKDEVTVNNLFLAFLDEGEGVGIRVLTSLGVDIDELYLEFFNNQEIDNKYKNKKKLLILENGIDLCKQASENKIDPVIGRETEINRLIEILLRRNKNNPLLIGEAGVGKTAIVEGLALRITKKDVPPQLLNKRIISISLANLVAGTKYRGEFEEKITKMITELENNTDIILFIDEIHSLVGAGGAEGAIDASNIFKPALARGKIKLIGATTTNEYRESIEKDKALSRRFQTIIVKEPNNEETKNILLKLKHIYEEFHHVVVNDEIIEAIIELTDKYIFNRKNPDKAIDILDEACIARSLIKNKNTQKLETLKKEYDLLLKEKNSYILKHDFLQATKLKKNELSLESKINKLQLDNKQKPKIVTIKDVALVIKNKTNIPVYEIDKESIIKLNNLENVLNENIIGQEKAINILSRETKKIKLGLKQNCRPTSFLFTGKSGVGKTELVKQYAKLLGIPLIRIDGSEYKESHTISKLLGSPPGYVGYDKHQSVLEELKNNPYAVILLDEIEKVNTNVLNLFLQILDEGFITNSNNEKIYFNYTIIIFTSNITANMEIIGFKQDNNNIIKNKLENVISIELINRIQHIIHFNNLTENNIKEIIKKQLHVIKKKLKTRNIKFNYNDNLIKEIISQSNYELSGARNIKKIIDDKVDDIIINNLSKIDFKVNL